VYRQLPMHFMMDVKTCNKYSHSRAVCAMSMVQAQHMHMQYTYYASWHVQCVLK
jgi:hypothetical protein